MNLTIGTIVEGKELLTFLLIPTEEKDIVVFFILLISTALLVVVFPFHVYFFILICFFANPFTTPSTATKMAAAASQQILIPYISLLKNGGLISTSWILLKTLHLLAYYVWHHWLQPQLQWGKHWSTRVLSFPVLHLLAPPCTSISKKSWVSWGGGLLNPSPTKETDDIRTNYTSSIGKKRTIDRRKKTGLLSIHDIGGDNIGLMATLI